MEALRRNTHLRAFDCYNTGMSEDFARDRFLPAVRANTSLRDLGARFFWGGVRDGGGYAAVVEAEELVNARAKADDSEE